MLAVHLSQTFNQRQTFSHISTSTIISWEKAERWEYLSLYAISGPIKACRWPLNKMSIQVQRKSLLQLGISQFQRLYNRRTVLPCITNELWAHIPLPPCQYKFAYIRRRFFDVRNMKDLFDSVTLSTILLYVRAIGLFFSKMWLDILPWTCTHLTITFFCSGLCLDS